MKLLVVVSSLDLKEKFSATPAWWQLMKALYEVGVEVIATPYQGPAVESMWWRAEPNPAKWQGDLFKTARDTLRNVLRTENPAVNVTEFVPSADASTKTESASDRAIRRFALATIAPLWERHLDRLLTREPDIDAVLFLTVPLNHLVGVPREIERKHNKPVFYYDGDLPASLPNMYGFASGFRIYHGADLSEYTAFVSNSEGALPLLKEMGARDAYRLYFGVDENLWAPTPVPNQDIDVFYYGHGREYRSNWIDAMLTEPSKAMPEASFAVRGTAMGDLGNVNLLPYLSLSKLREYSCRSKINLCITRRSHASLPRSSTSRPLELSSMGACVVASPYDGIEAWLEPEKEVIVVESQEEALDRYRYLLSHDTERQKMGEAARQRVLKEHTMRHRARRLVEIMGGYLK